MIGRARNDDYRATTTTTLASANDSPTYRSNHDDDEIQFALEDLPRPRTSFVHDRMDSERTAVSVERDGKMHDDEIIDLEKGHTRFGSKVGAAETVAVAEIVPTLTAGAGAQVGGPNEARTDSSAASSIEKEQFGRPRRGTMSRMASSLGLEKLHTTFQAYQTTNSYQPPHKEIELGEDALRINRFLEKVHHRYPKIGRALLYIRGPSPAWIETAVRPWWPKGETFFARHLSFFHRRRRIITPIFLLAWLLAFIFLVRESFFNSTTNVGVPGFIVADTSYWARDDQCGLNGTQCAPFTNQSFVFRCPSQTLSVELLNNRAVGAQEVIYEPLVVGGGDDLGTYRSDSWICPAAIHHGLFGDRKGGCGRLQLIGEFTGYIGDRKNGVKSVSFDSTFPSSYRFVDGISQGGCQDIRDEILGFNVAMTTIFSFLIRPAPAAFFWTLLCLGYWHVVLASDPSAMPPDVQSGFENFLPALFVGYAFWRFSWRWVVPAFETALLERTIFYLAGFWFGTLNNISLAWIPIDRLTAGDIQKQPGGLIALLLIIVFLFGCILNQIRVIRRTGWLYFYLFWYIIGGLIVAVLALLPGFELRIHHYIIGIILMPGCAFVTRPSAIFQGFLLGLFVDGAGRWGMASILQTEASLVGDGALGSALPVFFTSATNFTIDQAAIAWNAIPANLTDQWDGFSLLVDDVERYAGTATNYTIGWLNATIPHYFRIAYTSSGTSGDFTRAATAFISNGTWINPVPGAS